MKLLFLLALPFGTFAAEKSIGIANAAPALPAGITQLPKVAAVESYYSPGICFDLFGSARTFDLNNARTGAGLGINYWFDNNLGIGVDALTENTEGSRVDYATGNALWRITSGKAALNLSGGMGRDLERDEWYFRVGGGPEWAFNKTIHVFGNAYGQKGVEGGSIHALFVAGLRLNF